MVYFQIWQTDQIHHFLFQSISHSSSKVYGTGCFCKPLLHSQSLPVIISKEMILFNPKHKIGQYVNMVSLETPHDNLTFIIICTNRRYDHFLFMSLYIYEPRDGRMDGSPCRNTVWQQWAWWRWCHLLGVRVSQRPLESPAKANRRGGSTGWRWWVYDAFMLLSSSINDLSCNLADIMSLCLF